MKGEIHMSASAVAGAPAPKQPKQALPKQESERKKTPIEALRALPRSVGIALMALLIAVSLPVGNYRALQNATPTPLLRRREVVSIIEDRAAQAQNAVTVARQGGVSEALTQNVESAADALLAAKSAREVSRADQTLTSAMADLTAGANLMGESADMLRRAAANFAEQGSFLRQQARAYAQETEKAVSLYEKLPLRALLPAPDVYEGL